MLEGKRRTSIKEGIYVRRWELNRASYSYEEQAWIVRMHENIASVSGVLIDKLPQRRKCQVPIAIQTMCASTFIHIWPTSRSVTHAHTHRPTYRPNLWHFHLSSHHCTVPASSTSAMFQSQRETGGGERLGSDMTRGPSPRAAAFQVCSTPGYLHPRRNLTLKRPPSPSRKNPAPIR